MPPRASSPLQHQRGQHQQREQQQQQQQQLQLKQRSSSTKMAKKSKKKSLHQQHFEQASSPSSPSSTSPVVVQQQQDNYENNNKMDKFEKLERQVQKQKMLRQQLQQQQQQMDSNNPRLRSSPPPPPPRGDNNNNNNSRPPPPRSKSHNRSKSHPNSANDINNNNNNNNDKQQNKTKNRRSKSSNRNKPTKSPSHKKTLSSPLPSPAITNGTTTATTVSQFLQNQQTRQNRAVESAAKKNRIQQERLGGGTGTIITRRMTTDSGGDDDGISEFSDSFQTLETTLTKAHRRDNKHRNDGRNDKLEKYNNNNNNSNSNNNNIATPIVDTVPADHPSSNIIQTHRTCTLCHRDLPRSQFSTQDRYTVHLSLAPGAVCRTCSMTVCAVRLKGMASVEELLVEFGNNGINGIGGIGIGIGGGIGNRLGIGSGGIAGNALEASQQQLLLEGSAYEGALVPINRSNSGTTSGGGGNTIIGGGQLVPVGVDSFYCEDNINKPSSGPPNINGVFSSERDSRPTHIADCKYIDMLLGLLPKYPRLNELGLYTSSKEASVSLAALEAVRLYGTLGEECFEPMGSASVGGIINGNGNGNGNGNNRNRGNSSGRNNTNNINNNNTINNINNHHPNGMVNPKSIVCLVLGEGASPRTALLASQHYGWTTLSIDPTLSYDWDGRHYHHQENFTGYSGTISQFMDNHRTPNNTNSTMEYPAIGAVSHLIIIAIQTAHDSLRLHQNATMNDIRARYHDVPTTLVSMSPVRKATLAPKRKVGQAGSALERDVGYEPNCSYIDEGVFSECRFVEVWNFHTAEEEEDDESGDEEEYEDEESGSEFESGSEYDDDDEEEEDDEYEEEYEQNEGVQQHQHQQQQHQQHQQHYEEEYSREEDNHQYYAKGESWYDRDQDAIENPSSFPPSPAADDTSQEEYNPFDEEQNDDDMHEEEEETRHSNRHSRRSRSRGKSKSKSRSKSINKKELKKAGSSKSRSASRKKEIASQSSRSASRSSTKMREEEEHGEGGEERYANENESHVEDYYGKSQEYGDQQYDVEQEEDSRHMHNENEYENHHHVSEDEGENLQDLNYQNSNSREGSRSPLSRDGRREKSSSPTGQVPQESVQRNPFDDDSYDDDYDRNNGASQQGSGKKKNPFDDDYDEYSHSHAENQSQDVYSQGSNREWNYDYPPSNNGEDVWEKAMAKHEEQDTFCQQFEDYYDEQPRQEDPPKELSQFSESETNFVYNDDDDDSSAGIEGAVALNRWNNAPASRPLGEDSDDDAGIGAWSDDEDVMGTPAPIRRSSSGVSAKARPWANKQSDGHSNSFFGFD